MACNPLRWLWGLIPLSMLSFLAFHWERPVIEADLASRSKEMLGRQGLDWAHTKFDGRDATLTGKAVKEREPNLAREVLRRVWGVRVVDARTDLVAAVSDYTWQAERSDSRVRLGGYVASEQMRSTILKLAQAALPDITIEDQMSVARGAPEKEFWLRGIEFSLKQMASLKTGSITLDAKSLSIEGEAPDQGSYKSLRAAIPDALPDKWVLGRQAITPPPASPYTWSAEFAGNQLVLSGFAPDEETREALFTRAKQTFPRIAVVDRLELASGAPNNFAAAARLGLDQLQRLKEGTASLKDRDLSVTGAADDEATAEAVRNDLNRTVPNSYKVTEKISVLPPPLATVSIFKTVVVASEDGIDVTGYAPSEEARTTILNAIRSAYPGKTVRNKLELAAGAPDSWQTCTLAGITALGRLGAGTLTLSDTALVLAGETRDQTLSASISNGLQTTAGSDCEITSRIVVNVPREPNFWWQALHTDGAVILEGQAPDDTQKSELIKLVAESFPGARIEDRMVVVSKPSTKWRTATATAVRNLSRLHHGTAMLFLDDVYITGEAANEAAMEAVRAGLASDLPEGYVGRHSIVVVDREAIRAAEEREARRRAEEAEAKRRAEEEAEARRRREEEARRREEEDRMRREAAAREAAAETEARKRQRAEAETCQKLFREKTSSGTILFEYASDRLDERSKPTLDELAKLVAECPAVRVEVEGHTDSDGDPDRNQRLSVRRAQSVVTYLVQAGIARSRLSAIGHGQTRPVAPNDTNANKAKNRRIEFSVVTE